MKKFTLSGLIVFLLMLNIQVSADNSIIPISTTKTSSQVLSSSQNNMNLQFHFGDIGYFNVKTPEGTFTEILMGDTYSTNRIGEPILPAQKKLIAIPFGAEVSITVNSFSESTIDLGEQGINNALMPLQYDIPKSLDPSEVPFQYNKDVYLSKSFNESDIATIEILGTMRGVRIARVIIEPVRYNPSTNQLIVYNDIEVSLSYENADWELTNQTFESTYSPVFDVVYSQLLNVDNVYDDHPDLLTFPVNMLIVADPMFTDALQPFIEWKTLMGYHLTVAYTDVIGTSANDIQTWIHNEYNTGLANGNAPDFIVLVGDVQQVAASATGGDSGKKTDLYYGSVDGDMFPEMYYGRLSAQTVPQLEAQLNKILYYEKYQFDNPSYLDDVTLIAGADGSGNPNYGQPTITYGTDNYFNLQHGYNNLNVYLDSPYTGCYDDERIRVSFINYTAHCGETVWGTPPLNISDVNNFDNPNEYPIAIGNCCLAADFGYDECIGEAWLRAENKGAAGYLGSSPSSYWKADMYWSVGAYPMTNDNGNGYVPTYEETTMGAYDGAWGDSYYCLSGIVFVGNLSVSEVNMQGWLNDATSTYYWEGYNVLGDPSMMPYNTQGSENTVTHMDILPIGVTEYEVTAEPGSYVAITKDGVIYGTGYVESSGVVTVEMDPILESGDVNIVVTKSQFIPYMVTVPAAALEGPYLAISDFIFDNGTQSVDYATSVIMDISLSNLGTDPSDDVTITILFSDDYCTLTSSATISVGSIAADETIVIEDAYTFDIADDAPDMHMVSIDVDIEGTSKELWESSINFDIYAPIPDFGTYTIDDVSGNGNGRIDPGETVDITIQTINNGHAATVDGEMLISTTSAYLTINTPVVDVTIIDAEGMQEVTLNVTADGTTPIGSLVDINLDYSAGNYVASYVILETVGLIVEDFETGDFSDFDWQFNAYPWVIVDGDEAYEGNFASKSADITDDGSTTMELDYAVVADGEISFYYKVSSEGNYDYLKFYINGNEQGSWSGDVDWTEAIFDVAAGNNIFKWEYSKDGSVSSGEDCAWVDFIVFPPIMFTSVYAGPDAEICEGDVAQCSGTASNYTTLFWETSGTGDFDDFEILTPIYTPSADDIAEGSVSLSLTVIDADDETYSDTMILSFVNLPPEGTMPVGPESVDLNIVSQSEYTTDDIQYAYSYAWLLYPLDAGDISGTETVGTVDWNMEFDGEAWVKVAGVNDCGQGLYSDSVMIVVYNSVGINSNEELVDVSIIPNPNNGRFTVSVSSKQNNVFDISIVNALGKTIIESLAVDFNATPEKSFEISNIQSGIYYVVLQNSTSRIVKKLLIKNN